MNLSTFYKNLMKTNVNVQFKVVYSMQTDND